MKARPGFTDEEKSRMLLSPATRLGLRMTSMLFYLKIHNSLSIVSNCIALSFIEMVKYLFTLPDVSVFLSQRISQDPLENFFGCQRQRGGTHDNPNVQEFQKNMQALRVINSFIKTPVKGNCRGSGDMDMESLESMSTPLPKRKRKRTTPPANSSIQQPLTTNSQVTQTTTSTNSQPSLTVTTLTHSDNPHSQYALWLRPPRHTCNNNT